VIPAAVARHLVKSEGFAAGFHVGISPNDAEAIRIQFIEAPGIEMTAAMQAEVEKHFTRAASWRRVPASECRWSVLSCAPSPESYASDLLSTLKVEAIRERHFRIVVDYGFSAASYVLPLVLGPLGGGGGCRARLPERRRLRPARACCLDRTGKAARVCRSAPISVLSSTAPANGCTSSTSRRRSAGRARAPALLRLIGTNGNHGSSRSR